MLKAKGFTLIELMLATLLGTIVIGGIVYLLTTTLYNNKEMVKMARLNNELKNTMEIIVGDIRRAGYWANATSNAGVTANNNPFMAAATNLTINGARNCILFSYDHDKNGAIPAVSAGTDDERYGYRLINSKIQSRPVSGAYDCNAVEAAWDDLTSTNSSTITNLSFNLTNNSVDVDGTAGTATMAFKTVTITMTGTVPNNAAVSVTLTRAVKIRNNYFTP